MGAKRAAKAKEEEKEQRANEAIRRKSGKVRLQLLSVTVGVHILSAILGYQHTPGGTPAEGDPQGSRS